MAQLASGEPAEGAATRRLSEAIGYPTVSKYPRPDDPDAFAGFFEFLKREFPTLFGAAIVTLEAPWRLVLELPGRDDSLLPCLLLAHFDVVSADPTTDGEWTRPPFSGAVADGYIWGRGTMDDKSALMAILEAADSSLREGPQPERGLVLAFGGDEELSGKNGAGATASAFRQEGREFHFILDEGAVIADGILEDVPRRLALIGMGEKGHVNVTVRARGSGGHSGRPPRSTAAGVLARAIVRVENKPFPVRRLSTVESFFRTVGRVARGIPGFAYRHPGLMWPVMAAKLVAEPATNALVRTTQAVTMTQASPAPNVLPHEATCTINVRILPGETVESVAARFHDTLRDLPVEVEISDLDANDPVPEASSDHDGFIAIEKAMKAADPEVLVTPFLFTESTDSKHYRGLTDGIFRFAPVVVGRGDVDRFHGINERISVSNYMLMIRFYETLMRKVCWNE